MSRSLKLPHREAPSHMGEMYRPMRATQVRMRAARLAQAGRCA